MHWQIIILIVWVCAIGSMICRDLSYSARKDRYKLKIKPHTIYVRLQDSIKETTSGTLYEFREIPIIDKTKEKEQATELTTICPYCATDIRSYTVNKLMKELSKSVEYIHMTKSDELEMKMLFEKLNCHIINDIHNREPMTKDYISTMIDTKCPVCKSRFQVYFKIRKLRNNTNTKSRIKSRLHMRK